MEIFLRLTVTISPIKGQRALTVRSSERLWPEILRADRPALMQESGKAQEICQ
jgi:hypothetical protein